MTYSPTPYLCRHRARGEHSLIVVPASELVPARRRSSRMPPVARSHAYYGPAVRIDVDFRTACDAIGRRSQPWPRTMIALANAQAELAQRWTVGGVA